MDGMNSHTDGAFPALRKPVTSTKSALVAQARERHSHDKKMEGFSKEHSNIMTELRREQKKISKSLESLLTRQQAIKGNKRDTNEPRNYLSCDRNDTHLLRGRLTKSLDTTTSMDTISTRRLTRQLSCRSESSSPLPSYGTTRAQSSSDEEKDFLHPWIRSNSSPDSPSFMLRTRKGLSGRETHSSASSEYGSYSSPEPSPPASPRRTVPRQYRKLNRSASDTQAPSEHHRANSEGAFSPPLVPSTPGSGRHKRSSIPKLPDVQRPKSLSVPSSPQMLRHDMCLLVPKRHSFNAKRRSSKGKMSSDIDAGDYNEFCSLSDGTCYRLPKQGRAKPRPRERGRRQSVADGVPQIVTSLDTSRETDEFWYLRYVLEDSPNEV